VIVAGGTGALGRAIVEALLAGGARVAVPYMHAAGWDELRALGKGTSLFGAQADLGDAGATRAFVDQAAAFLGVLDGVAIASGAWSGGTTLEAAPADEWDRMMTTNLATVHSVCRAALPRLLKQGGSVVTVGGPPQRIRVTQKMTGRYVGPCVPKSVPARPEGNLRKYDQD